MSETERLQKAIRSAIESGYQLNKEAFEFLSIISTTEDPVKLVNEAIQEMKNLKKERLFICRDLLEELAKRTDSTRDIGNHSLQEPAEKSSKLRVTEGKKTIRPYAREVEANIKIIEDPTDKLNSTGTIEDYARLFRDRFKRTERLLRKRIDVKSASSVTTALEAQANTKLKIIAMVTRKRESKKKILLTVEDLRASATVLVPENAPYELIEKAASLLLDQVVCLSVVKTRTKLLVAKDITLPDVAKKQQNRAPVPVYAVFTSDMHVGSIKFQKEAFNRFILWLNGRYGNRKMRMIASRVKYVLIAGDIVDGIGIYPNQIKELAVKEIYQQYKLAGKLIEQIPDYIEVMIIPGNHDSPRKALPQPAISNEFLEPLQELRKVHSIGNPSVLSIHNVQVLLYHGRSLEDVMSTVPGMEHEHPEKAMTLLLRSRHLAPAYGGKTPISPETRDFLVIEHSPDIFHSGHIHILKYNNYRGTLVINSGCWQGQTDYMRRHGFLPTPGKVPVVNLQTLEMAIIPFV